MTQLNRKLNCMKWLLEQSRKWLTKSSVQAFCLDFLLIQIGSHMHSAPVSRGSFVTRANEFRCETLPDESTLCLDANTSVRYRISGTTRNIEGESGRFSVVVQNDRRPFDVMVGNRLLLHDSGTGFVVDIQPDGSSRITVTDGRVRILAPVSSDVRSQFQRGERQSAWKAAPEFSKYAQIEFDPAGNPRDALPDLSDQQLSALRAFEVGLIALDDQTVSQFLRELRRYHRDLPKFKCSPATGAIHLSGFIQFNAPLPGTLEYLKSFNHIRYADSGSGSKKVITLTGPSDKVGDTQPAC